MRVRGAWRSLAVTAVLVVCCAPEYTFVPPAVATCDDGVENGSESDIDCGGSCQACETGRLCAADADCALESCVDRVCQAAHCVDQTLADGETDVDCGGPECPRCGVHQGCSVAADCKSNSCMSGECVATGCDDDTVDGSETDLNCGGDVCPACRVGMRCELGGDCVTGICLNGTCSTEACGNGTRDPGEEGTDCGGSCPRPCAAEDNCSNEKQSESETDIDCGGGTCPRCGNDSKCVVDADCTSGFCDDEKCAEPCTGTSCGEGGMDGSGGTTGGSGGSGGSGGTGGEMAGMGGLPSAGAGGVAGGGAPATGGVEQGGADTGGMSAGVSGSGGVSGMSGASQGGAPNGGTGVVFTEIMPEPTCAGCARLEVPIGAAPDKGNYAINLSGTRDFTSAVITYRVYRQAGSGGQIKGYVQHNGSPDFNQLFQDPPVDLASLTGWQILTWDIGAQSTTYDKSIVGRVGIQIIGTGATSWTDPTVVYLDGVRVNGPAIGPWLFDASSSVGTTPTTSSPVDVLFCNSGDSPVAGAGCKWVSR